MPTTHMKNFITLLFLISYYSLSQNNIVFQPQDNSVSIGKNSQIKPRKSEQGQGL
jgi:hypothetical protein